MFIPICIKTNTSTYINDNPAPNPLPADPFESTKKYFNIYYVNVTINIMYIVVPG